MIKAEAAIVGADELTSQLDIAIRGVEVRNLVCQPEVRRYLERMHLPGVILRNTPDLQEYFDFDRVPRAITALETARDLMKSGEQASYSILDRQPSIESSGYLICRTTIQPALSLRKQWLPLKPGHARRLPHMSKELDMTQLGVNLGVWSDPRKEDFASNIATGVHMTAEKLAVGTAAWIIVPRAALRHYPGIEEGLYEGGFSEPHSSLRWYDDDEDRRSPPPLSVLFVAPSFGRLSVANS